MYVMLKCHKNYCNLLLLSVMLFALGASARPAFCGMESGCCYVAHSSGSEFAWQTPSGTVVYCGQQLTAVAGNEFIWKNPDVLEMLANYDIGGSKKLFSANISAQNVISNAVSRAPPCV